MYMQHNIGRGCGRKGRGCGHGNSNEERGQMNQKN